jgi:hypothetical protein
MQMRLAPWKTATTGTLPTRSQRYGSSFGEKRVSVPLHGAAPFKSPVYPVCERIRFA